MRSSAWLAISAPWSQVSDRSTRLGQFGHPGGHGLTHRLGAVPGQRGPILFLGRRHDLPSRGRCNSTVKRVVRSTSVPIAERFGPMIRSPSQWPGTSRPSTSAGRSLINTSGVTDFLPRPSRTRTRHPQRPPGAQTGDNLAPQPTPALNVERLVDRFVGDPHGVVVGKVEPQPVRDLFRAPRLRPTPVLNGRCCGTIHVHPGPDSPPHRPPDPRRPAAPARTHATHQIPASFAAFGRFAAVPPSTARSTPDTPACRARRRVAPQLPRDRRRRPTHSPRDLPHAHTLSPKGERSPPARQRYR